MFMAQCEHIFNEDAINPRFSRIFSSSVNTEETYSILAFCGVVKLSQEQGGFVFELQEDRRVKPHTEAIKAIYYSRGKQELLSFS